MSPESTPPAPDASAVEPRVSPITSLDDARVIQMLTTEHMSVIATRALVYNEAFTRAGMFLAFLSTSFVALALLADAMAFSDQFLTVAAIVLAFDFVIGFTTFARIGGANFDDLRMMHGMARIRHGYVQVAPILKPYFTSATHDDMDSVVADYGIQPGGPLQSAIYGLSTSLGMTGLIVAMNGGVLVSVLALLAKVPGDITVWIGVASAVLILGVLVVQTIREVPRTQATLGVHYPAADPKTES
jgi:hypothetical protein